MTTTDTCGAAALSRAADRTGARCGIEVIGVLPGSGPILGLDQRCGSIGRDGHPRKATLPVKLNPFPRLAKLGLTVAFDLCNPPRSPRSVDVPDQRAQRPPIPFRKTAPHRTLPATPAIRQFDSLKAG